MSAVEERIGRLSRAIEEIESKQITSTCRDLLDGLKVLKDALADIRATQQQSDDVLALISAKVAK